MQNEEQARRPKRDFIIFPGDNVCRVGLAQ